MCIAGKLLESGAGADESTRSKIMIETKFCGQFSGNQRGAIAVPDTEARVGCEQWPKVVQGVCCTTRRPPRVCLMHNLFNRRQQI